MCLAYLDYSIGFQKTGGFRLRGDVLSAHGRDVRSSKYLANRSFESSAYGQGNQRLSH